MPMSNESFPAMLATLKRSAGALREAGIPFMLGGGLACWVRGGPESDHDLDLMVKPEDAEQALATLTAIGLRPEKPSEGWLYKAFDEDVMVDIIFSPVGVAITDEVLARAEMLEVEAQPMLVMTLDDVLVTKLLALDENSLDYKASASGRAQPARADRVGGRAHAHGRLALRGRLLYARGGARRRRDVAERRVDRPDRRAPSDSVSGKPAAIASPACRQRWRSSSPTSSAARL